MPAELERIVSKALRKDREERYQTVKDLLLDLKSLKQELEFEAKLERAAEREVRAGAAAEQALTAGESAAVPTLEDKRATSTSARPLASGIKRPTVTIVALVALVMTLVMMAYFYFASSGKAINSLAVLPFVNDSKDPETEYLSDGMTESLINNLSQLPHLKVMSRISVFHYKGKETDARAVGRELGVQAVLTGRVVQRGDNLAISLELVNADDNSHIWGAQYNRKLSDLIAVPGDISQEVTENLRLKLSGEEKQRLAKRYTNNTEAYQAYLKGVYYSQSFTPSGFEEGIKDFDRGPSPSIPIMRRLTPGLLLHTGNRHFWDRPPQEALLKARPAAKHALELDETLVEAHLSLANIYMYYDWDWPTAEREIRGAPSNSVLAMR